MGGLQTEFFEPKSSENIHSNYLSTVLSCLAINWSSSHVAHTYLVVLKRRLLVHALVVVVLVMNFM